jgi:hypothetical protein
MAAVVQIKKKCCQSSANPAPVNVHNRPKKIGPIVQSANTIEEVDVEVDPSVPVAVELRESLPKMKDESLKQGPICASSKEKDCQGDNRYVFHANIVDSSLKLLFQLVKSYIN